jgi:para-aminobenzoate synthetase component I
VIKSKIVREIHLNADELVNSLLELSGQTTVCILDSCGVSYLDSHFLIGGIQPVKILEISGETADKVLEIFEREISQPNLAAVFTLSYDFGLKIQKIKPRPKEFKTFDEPDIFLALFEVLIIHDYQTGKTFLTGNEKKFDEIEKTLFDARKGSEENFFYKKSKITSNFTRREYIYKIEQIKDFIRRGDTYQTNLTRQFRAELPDGLTSQMIFRQLRKNHPAPFSAFIRRKNDFVVSISPERFFKVQSSKFKVQTKKSKIQNPKSKIQNRVISTSPIKGTRPRGKTPAEDLILREELLNSAKERAENVMIVDLLRNDLGRVCEFGSVRVEKLCELETHPTFFHLVSTVCGDLRENINLSDILKAVFPCGSITGAPKISTMRIIDEIETANRGLSMGAIGFKVQSPKSKVQSRKNEMTLDFGLWTLDSICDLSVAIRTMVIKNNEAVFNVGGGIVIDSIPENEYEETLIKARALFRALNANGLF